ncbi:MAG TPA: thioesterase family protein [Lacunisphaera sp.]|nr:thioesterase family protein [Lacunisphaera sp.]
MIESRTQITVRYAETDMMGIVYHGSYLPWFEVGRTTLLKECGIVYRDLEARGFRLPVVELGVKFSRPALYDDTVTVITRLNERPLLRIRLDYEVRRGDELLVTGFTVHTFINRAGEPVRPPAEYAAKMRELFGGA